MAKILIVDDSEADRLLVKSVLEDEEHDFYFAGNGNGAKHVLDTKPVDLIITDLSMPEKDGLQFIREIRDQGCVLPVIAISGVRAGELDVAVEFGAGAVLAKPLDGERLRRTVEACLAQPRRRIWDSHSRLDRGG